MCGIAGIVSSDRSLVTAHRIRQMTDAIAHRGPDGEQLWMSPEGHVGLGHRRLAVIDLSELAVQPMHYAGRYTIVYNGEIYNYVELRESLLPKGYTFRSQSDTEVILAAYAAWGQDCVQYFDGMFAFAIWDEQEQVLFAARDRFGEKPFYYHQSEEGLLFASEMKALWAAGVKKQMRQDMLFNYLTLGYVQHPADAGATFYETLHKLPAHHTLLYNVREKALTLRSYWDLDARNTNTNITEEQAVKQMQDLLQQSVQRRLRSDVAVGTSLSGGLDSSSILAHICQGHHSKHLVQTFSAVFPGYSRDESGPINVLTGQLGIANHQVTPDADAFLHDFEAVCYHQEEPFQSASVAAQYKVFELARKHQVTVLLDGQGADETLAGYTKYYPWYWRELFTKDKAQWKAEMAAMAGVPGNIPWSWKEQFSARWPSVAKAYWKQSRIRRQKQHEDLTGSFLQTAGISHYAMPAQTDLNGVLYYNTLVNGLEELLQYADRNAMAHGREVRLPFLSHELVEFVFSLPSHFKIRNGYSKWILRKSMEPLLPAGMVWRKDKIGFDPPQQQWMQHPAVVAHIQDAKKLLIERGILNPLALNKKNQPQETHAADNFDWRYLVAGTLLR